jgi:hypothetical protein
MRTIQIALVAAALCGAALLARRVDAAVTAAPGYAVRAIPTPGTVQGGVVRVGADIFVGQGPTFTAGAQSVIRFTEGGPATTIASGFNSLGGFDIAADGTVYLVDNGLDAPGATSGDTLYAIPDAPTRTSALASSAAEVLPSGSIHFAQDVLVVPGAVLVSNAAGPGAGTVVHVAGSTATNLITGLDYAAGLALDGSTLLVGNLNGSFVGSVGKYGLDGGTSAGTLVGGLSGTYGVVVDGDGFVLVSGGSTSDHSSSTVVAVDPSGTVTERAHGFTSSGDLFFDPVRNETLVLDFAALQITAICRDHNLDGTCDADEPCTGVPVTNAHVSLKRLSDRGTGETFAFKGEMTLPVPFDPPLDPVTKGVRVHLGTAQAAATDVVIPPGAFDPAARSGWKANPALTAWTFLSSTPSGPLGITKVSVKTVAKTPGLVKFAVSGKAATVNVVQADLPLAATLTLDVAGQCGNAAFFGGGATCVFNATGSTVSCK